jgi:putative ABC transport system permease protein
MRFSILKEITQMAVDSLKTHKLRSVLTLLGIMIGVMTVIGMVSIIQGLNRSFLAELESAGTNLIVVQKFNPGPEILLSREERQRKDLTFEDALAIEENCSLVKAVVVSLVADLFAPITIKYQNKKTQDSLVVGMNENYPEILSVYLPEQGRFLTEGDITHSRNVCVLGAEVAETLFPHTFALGKRLDVGGKKFTIVGILKKRGTSFGQSQDNFVGIPITTLMKHFPYDLSSLQIIATPNKEGYIQETMDQIINVLRLRRRVPTGKPNDFVIFSQDTMIEIYNQLTDAAYLVMIVISSIGLLVGGIGVMNIMLVSVKERTREIGIRKAIGARSGDILKQFLIEAVFLTATGGIIGILVGFGIALLVKAVTPLPASVTGWSVILGFVVSVSVGIFFGIFPAQKAARLDPIVSLRYE